MIYSVWNIMVAALQFWTTDLEAHMVSSAIEQVYNAFFYSTSMHLLCHQSDEISFGHYVTALNAAFESKLALEDKGYESGSESFNIPTPLRRTSKIHHVSSVENASFDPDPVTPCSTGTRESHCRPVHRHSTYSSSEDDNGIPTNEIPSPDSTLPVQYHTDTILQVHIECVCYPRSRGRRRRRGLPNSPIQWWSLGYGGNPWQAFMYSWTFITTWNMSIPMYIFGLLGIILLWHIGFEWYLWVWRPDDYIQ